MPESSARRIVSLIASATEIVCALGLRDRLVGISHECDWPEDVRGLPVLSEPKMDPSRPGGEIDRDVRALVREGLSVYRVREDRLSDLRPDLIVTQDQCEVCAVSLKDVEEACAAVTLAETRVCSLKPVRLADVEEDFRRVARAAGVPERGEALVAALRSRLEGVRARASGRPRPKVACLEWLDPPMAAGGWIPALVRTAGGEPVLVSGEAPFRTVAWDDVRAANPDVVVLMPCGYTVGRSRQDMADERIAGPLQGLRATREGRCFIVDGNAYFNRPGPRLAESAEILASLLRGEGGVPPGAVARWC